MRNRVESKCATTSVESEEREQGWNKEQDIGRGRNRENKNGTD